ncbi:MAG: RsmB/NOP family class I SAM-dependent RNA methyltransferase [Candidatus Woesearchaeota archaeon]
MTLEQIPQNIIVKPGFEERYRKLLGDRYEEFMKYSSSYIRKGVRINTIKANIETVKKSLSKNWKLTQVPWCPEGFWIDSTAEEKRFDVGNTPEHFLGQIYVQEPASMIPPVVLTLTPLPENAIVIDMCAAPGSKSTQLAQYMNNEGILIANEVSVPRIQPLSINLQRCGVKNQILTLSPGQALHRLGPVADRVLVDAPCSATGTIRRSLRTLQMWSPRGVQHLAREQHSLLKAGWQTLKQGGEMVYSTCTLEPEEDEGVISEFLSKNEDAELLPIDIDIKRSEPILEWEGKKYDERVKHCLRIYPQDNDSEGFFVARIKKK